MTSTWSHERPPTIDDIRYLECFICREEETRPSPSSSSTDPSLPRKWVHPCTCKLVAHESCLLTWISQAQSSKPDKQALRCPQCKTRYIIDSEKGICLYVMEGFDKVLAKFSGLVAGSFGGAIIISALSGVYILFTAWGEHALRMGLGTQIYRHFFGDEWSDWPWHAFINVPLIPIVLLASRIPRFNLLMKPLYWLPFTLAPSYSHHFPSSYPEDSATWQSLYFTYPPHPAWIPLVFPLLKRWYEDLKERVTCKVLDIPRKVEPTRPRRFLWDIERFQGRLEIDWVDGEGNVVAEEEGQGDQQAVDALPLAAAPEGEEAAQQPPPLEPIPAAPDADPQAAAADIAIRVTPLTIGRIVGGALLLPTISSLMGALLYRISTRYKLYTLQRLLGIRMNHLRVVPPHLVRNPEMWRELDPVYWRNTIGLGLYIVAKDCVTLFHLWLKKRELATRQIRNRTFEGVDASTLDLFPTSSS